MKQKLIFLIVCLIISAIASGQQKQPDKLLREAIYQEEVNGNLEEAIKKYQAIVKDFPGEREIAAKALLRKGLCYERLGSERATEAYKQIINQYSDQVNLVTQAKERLTALQRAEPDGLTITKLLTQADYLECQTLSPDGTKLAGIGWDTGQNIVVCDLSTGKMKKVTHYDYGEKSCSAYNLVWSPDSKEIAYSGSCWGIPDEESSQLRIADLDGNSSTLYINRDTEGIIPCDWSPDKSAVLAVRGDKNGLYKLVLISVKNGALREICPLQMTFKWQDVPEWDADGIADISPDGQYVVFDDGPSVDKHDIFIIPMNGGKKISLTDHPAIEKEPRWSPDGRNIVFRSNRQGNWALWGLAIRDGQADGVPFLILEDMQDKELAGWVQKGICTRSKAYPTDVYTLEIDPVNHDPLGKPRILETQEYGNSMHPFWSPDGKYLFFRSLLQPDNYFYGNYIMIMPAGGGEVRKFKFNYPIYPQGGFCRWLPDGSGIGWLGWDHEKYLYSSILDLAKGEWENRQIPKGDFTGGVSSFAWSKDGHAFYYSKAEGADSMRIIRHDLITGKEQNMHGNLIADSQEWSRLNLNSSRDNKLAFKWNNKLCVFDLNTGNYRYVECGDGQELFVPTLSPDCKYLLVKGPHKKGDEINELFIVSLTDGKYKSLNISQYLPEGARIMTTLDWSPDGKTIAFDIRTWKSEVYLLQNVIAVH